MVSLSDGELLVEDDYRFFFYKARVRRGQCYQVIEKSPRVWRRFSLLLNIPGQKYTIGDEFKCRKEQGEVIFWCRDDEEDEEFEGPNKYRSMKNSLEAAPQREKVGSMCEIQVENGKYWIMPLGKTQIRINDTRIKGRSELQFGDYLVFGTDSETNESKNGAGFLSYPNVLWFRKRELNSDAFLKHDGSLNDNGDPKCSLSTSLASANFDQEIHPKEEMVSTPLALKNDLILFHILSYFSCQELKASRFVSKLWDQEAKKLLKRKGRVIFGLDKGWWWGDHWDRANDSMQFLRYSWDMKEMRMQNWTLKLPAFPVNMGDGPESKFLSDLTWFFSKEFSHPVKKLKLKGDIGSKLCFDIRIKILERLESTLEELDFSVPWNMVPEESKQCTNTFSGPNLFQKLQRLRIRWNTPAELLESLLVTGLKAIYLPGQVFDDKIFLDKLSCFSNLEEIRVDCVKPSWIKSLLQGVKKGLKLKKMDLGRLGDYGVMTPEGISDFNALLSTHASSLESLAFILPHRLESNLQIVFPVFSKLKELIFGLSEDKYTKDEFEVRVSFVEPLGRINYAEHFPFLESLSIWPLRCTDFKGGNFDYNDIFTFWKDHTVLYNMFFPEHSHGETLQTCETLRVLDIPFQGSLKRPKMKDTIFERAPELARVFPNVHNEWTTEARAVPYPATRN